MPLRDVSLSARRAWIEIEAPSSAPYAELVALRKESVDRNPYLTNYHFTLLLSLSARRAWIEIMSLNTQQRHLPVALRKESVDRNFCHEVQAYA